MIHARTPRVPLYFISALLRRIKLPSPQAYIYLPFSYIVVLILLLKIPLRYSAVVVRHNIPPIKPVIVPGTCQRPSAS